MSKRPFSRRQLRRFVPNLRRLEDRTVPAGNVAVAVFENILYVVGDDANNQISITGAHNGSVEIRSLDGTTAINGQFGPIRFSDAWGGIHAVLNGGDDTLSLASYTANRNLNIAMGAGNDNLTFFDVYSRRTTNLFTQEGNDSVMIVGSGFYKSTVIDTAEGDDLVNLSNSFFFRDTFANGGLGANNLINFNNFFNNLVQGNFNGGMPTPPPTTAPTAVNDSGTADRGGSVTINVAANDVPASGTTLDLTSIIVTGAPAFGTATANANGTITYVNTNATTTSSIDSFRYTIRNTAGQTSNEAIVTITLRDTTSPTVTITTTATDPTNLEFIPFTFTFSEAINNLEFSDPVVTNGVVDFITRTGTSTFLVEVVANGPGPVSISLPAGAVTDINGNPNLASNTLTITFDNVAPVVTINPLTTSDSTPTLTGTVDDPNATVTVTVGGQTFQATVTGTTWSGTVPTPLADGTYTISVTAVDPASNTTTEMLPDGLVITSAAPMVTITTTEPNPTTANPIPFTVTFDQPVTGFTIDGLTITNGTASNFVMVDAQTYTFDVAPTAPGLVTVTVNADAAMNAAGVGNAETTFTITAASPNPTPTITGPGGTATNVSPIPITVTFSEDVTGFELGDVVVTNGTASNFVAVDGRTYTFDVTPIGEGFVTVQVPAGVAEDADGNPNLEGNFSIEFDITAPAAPVITGLDPTSDTGTPGDGITNVNTPTIIGTGEPGATIELFADDGTGPVSLGTAVVDENGDWSFTVTTALADGTYTLTATQTDPAGNVSPTSAGVSITIDTVAPVATITTTEPDPTSANVIPFTVTFDEDVMGFTEAGVTVTNGTLANFVMVDARTYTFDVMPIMNGVVTVTVNADAATDVAGNGVAETSFNIVSDRLLPVITTTAPDPTNQSPIPFTVTFTRDVTGFEIGDLVITNGTASNFVVVDARTYTFDVTPIGDGIVTVQVPAGVAEDSNGNPNVEANFSITFDTTAPAAPVITGLDAGSDSGTPGDGITNINTPTIIGTGESGATIEIFADDGTGPVSLGTTVVDANGDWSFAVTTALADGTYELTATATDAAGNVSPMSAIVSITIDTVAPVATITTTEPNPSGASVIPFTVTFDEDVTGFSETDITVDNGALSNFVMVDARTYTFDVTPTTNGLVTVTVAEDGATDIAGNGVAETSFSITSDRFAPVITTLRSPTNDSPIPFTVTFTRDATGFEVGDLVVTNGTVSNFVMISPRVYNFDVTPGVEGTVTVTVPAGVALDPNNNPNVEGTISVIYDITPPPVPVVTGLDPNSDTGIVGDNFTTNTTPTIIGTGEAGSIIQVFAAFAGSNPMPIGTTTVDASGNWSLTPANPFVEGPFTITARASDAAGNESAESNQISIVIDTTPPEVTLTTTASNPTNLAVIPFTATLSEQLVTGFDETAITVTNGTVSNFMMTGLTTYTFDVTPNGDGLVTITIAAGAFTDLAGNDNLEATTSIVSEQFNPIATITTTASNPTNLNPIPFTVTFNEDVTGFTIDDLTITNGTASNFVMVDARTYTFDVTPTTEGLVTVEVEAGAVMDSGGNTNAAATLSITFDSTAPAAPTITGLDPGSDSGTLGDGITNVTSPTIIGTAEAGSTVEIFADSGSGAVSLGTVVADGSGAWSFTPTTPLTDAVYAVTAVATDPAGNASSPSTGFLLLIDTTEPEPTITTTAPDPTNLSPIPFTVTFSESVSGFTVAGLTVTNGSASNFTAVNATTYTFDVTPLGDGVVTVTVTAGVATDAAGNANTSVMFSIMSDVTPPTGTISGTGTGAITGTAMDNMTGVTNVAVSIFNGVAYWDGAGFNSATPIFFNATTSNNFLAWSIAFSQTGTFTVTAQITDGAGNVTEITQSVTLTP
jgi:hypothetical protein